MAQPIGTRLLRPEHTGGVARSRQQTAIGQEAFAKFSPAIHTELLRGVMSASGSAVNVGIECMGAL
jgi:hypothetical protein